MLKTSRNYTLLLLIFCSSHHSVCLSWTSLAIRENSTMISQKNILDQLSPGFLEYFRLLTFFSKYLIKTKYLSSLLMTILMIKCNLFFVQVVADELNIFYGLFLLILFDFYFSRQGRTLTTTLTDYYDIFCFY